jgi:peptidoglycan/xylan/chitin deacetylase (PgdA/CDA1 family)
MVPGGWTVTYLRDQITRTADLQQQLTGHRPCFFRPPGGFRTNVSQAAYGLGMSVVLWSVDTLDWRQPGLTTAAATAAIVARATAVGGQQHPIVLMHSGKASPEPASVVSPNRSNTVAALPAIIAWYAAHGYRFVAL